MNWWGEGGNEGRGTNVFVLDQLGDDGTITTTNNQNSLMKERRKGLKKEKEGKE